MDLDVEFKDMFTAVCFTTIGTVNQVVLAVIGPPVHAGLK